MTTQALPTVGDAQLLEAMLRIRSVEETIATLYAEQLMRCPVHLSIGQEAVAVGVCAALDRADYALSGHRSHAHYLAKGGSLPAMMAELYGRADGCTGGIGGSMHLVDLVAGFVGAVPIVGSTIPIAVGTALASQMRGESRVTAVFFGEGATEEGVFHESVNFAVLKRLPVLFICENNLFSVYSPMSVRQPAHREVFEVARGHGIESAQADGNDVRRVQELSLRAVERAREGAGPTFLELKTYRWREHCGPNFDNDIGYRTVEEFEAWQATDPVACLRSDLLAHASITEGELDAMGRKIKGEVQDAVAFARRSPLPRRGAMFEHLYA